MAGSLGLKKFRHSLGVEPDWFVYRVGPVPLGTGRTGPAGSATTFIYMHVAGVLTGCLMNTELNQYTHIGAIK
jgi:hypothetical protein